jgi:aspartate racemase
MKKLGLIGGTTWVSTVDYYKILNQEVNKALGENHSAPLILYSIEFQEALTLMRANETGRLYKILYEGAKVLEYGGASAILLGANTIHQFADRLMADIPLPIIHIVDETALKIKERGMSKVGLLGTKPTMNEAFYHDKLRSHGIDAIVPAAEDKDFIHEIIFSELGRDIFKDSTRSRILEIMGKLHQQGAEGMILGCTEIPLIINPGHTDIPLFNTLRIHAEAGARFMLDGR